MKRFSFEDWRLCQVQFAWPEGSVTYGDNDRAAKVAGLRGLNFIVGLAVLIFMLD